MWYGLFLSWYIQDILNKLLNIYNTEKKSNNSQKRDLFFSPKLSCPKIKTKINIKDCDLGSPERLH